MCACIKIRASLLCLWLAAESGKKVPCVRRRQLAWRACALPSADLETFSAQRSEVEEGLTGTCAGSLILSSICLESAENRDAFQAGLVRFQVGNWESLRWEGLERSLGK